MGSHQVQPESLTARYRRTVSKIAQKHQCNAFTILLQPQNLAAEGCAMLSQAKFHHRQNKYGGQHSICDACLMTVALVQHEWELASLESAHVCDPVNLYWISRGRESARVPDQAI